MYFIFLMQPVDMFIMDYVDRGIRIWLMCD